MFAFKGGRVYTYNDECLCRAPSPLPKGFTAGVPARDLLEVLARLPDDELTVGLEEGGGRLAVRGLRRLKSGKAVTARSAPGIAQKGPGMRGKSRNSTTMLGAASSMTREPSCSAARGASEAGSPAFNSAVVMNQTTSAASGTRHRCWP